MKKTQQAKRYRLDLLVRMDGTREGAEQRVHCYSTSTSELAARRTALEIAWAGKLLVSRFLAINVIE